MVMIVVGETGMVLIVVAAAAVTVIEVAVM